MKSLTTGFLLLFAATSFGQGTAGINPEHLSPNAIHQANHLPQRSQPEVKTIQLSTGVKLQYAEQGAANGVPVIFLHGLSDSWHSFETTLPHLPATIHAFALSQRGHGNSDKSAADYSTKAFAADVAAFIQQKNLGPVVIVGHSMGGVNAMRFAVEYPRLTKALVILSSDPNFRGNTALAAFRKEVEAMPDGAMDNTFMEAFQSSTLVQPIDSAYYRLLVAEGMKVNMNIFKAAINGMATQNLLPKLLAFKKPVLVLWGEKDNFCDAGSQQALKKALPRCRYICYALTGHALHWEAPERFASDLLQFIQSLPRK